MEKLLQNYWNFTLFLNPFHSFGNIFKQSMPEIWNSERFRRFRETIDKPDAKVPFLCTLCRAYDYSERAKKYGIDKTL